MKREIVKWIIVGMCIGVTSIYVLWYYQTIKQLSINTNNIAEIAKWVCSEDPVACGVTPTNSPAVNDTTK